jgi:uncharacterized protein YjiS (DUF1127 family)
MAQITTNPIFVPHVSFFDRFKSYLSTRAKHHNDQRTYFRMLRMSNRDLADIGLTRDDVREVMVRPMRWHNG